VIDPNTSDSGRLDNVFELLALSGRDALHSMQMLIPPAWKCDGELTFFCSTCRRTFNERTGTPFNYLQAPTDVVFLVVLWRLRYKLSLRDVAEMFLARGFVFTHGTVRDWECRFAPLIAAQLRRKRHGQAGKSWYVDETSIVL
jgi:hypothetical protein